MGMMTWMQESEQKCDAHHEENKLWGAGITNMIAKLIKGVALGQEATEKERVMTAAMEKRGLVVSQDADTTQEGAVEQGQQLQQQPKPKLPVKLQPKPEHNLQP